MYQVEGEVLSGDPSVITSGSTGANNSTSGVQNLGWFTPCPYCDPPRCAHCGRVLAPYRAIPYYPAYPYPGWPPQPWITYTTCGDAGNT
jgi:hypothetical protein